jgi:hypothetical protein
MFAEWSEVELAGRQSIDSIQNGRIVRAGSGRDDTGYNVHAKK